MGRRLALLIATYEYEDSGLRRLTAPAHDAETLADVLADPDIAGFEVRTLVNEPAHRVGEAISEFYRESRRDDLALLYFTGHGLKDDNGRLYLAMSNTKRDSLLFTGLSAEQIDQAMTDCPSRQKVLVLDCCYSGAYATQQFAKADSAVHTLERFEGRARTVLTASDSTQYAFEGSKIHGEATESVFTRHLVAGLRDGSADLDRDGDITLDELYSYVYERVTAEQPNQRPKRLDNVEGRTVIAANVNWALPAYLHTTIASPVATDRKAAIEPLGQLLRASNDRVRRTAREQLERLVQDHDPEVAAAAQARLDAPIIEPPRIAEGPKRAASWSSGQDSISISAALRASVRRWRGRLGSPTVPRVIRGLVLVSVLLFVAAVIEGFRDGDWSPTLAGYLTAAATATAGSLVVIAWPRSRAAAGVAFLAGLTAPAVVGLSFFVGWFTGWLDSVGSAGLVLSTLLLALAGHVAWIGAGVLSLVRLRREQLLDFRIRRPAGREEWAIVGLAALAAAAALVVQLDDIYHLRTVFLSRFWIIPTVAGLLAIELPSSVR